MQAIAASKQGRRLHPLTVPTPNGTNPRNRRWPSACFGGVQL